LLNLCFFWLYGQVTSVSFPVSEYFFLGKLRWPFPPIISICFLFLCCLCPFFCRTPCALLSSSFDSSLKTSSPLAIQSKTRKLSSPKFLSASTNPPLCFSRPSLLTFGVPDNRPFSDKDFRNKPLLHSATRPLRSVPPKLGPESFYVPPELIARESGFSP